MKVSTTSRVLAATAALVTLTQGAPRQLRRTPSDNSDPFAILDKQDYVMPQNMTWGDYVPVPGINWADPSRKGSSRNFNIALVAVDYPDADFVIMQEPGSTVFTNPQPIASDFTIIREEVPAFYRDFLNRPQELNRNHTLHEYWMEDSAGRFGVDLTSFGPYRLPQKSYEYGIDDEPEYGFNPGACPEGDTCSVDLRTDALGAWRAEVGNDTANSYELVFILSAGQDESSTWQEFGEIMFASPEDVPDEFGPPGDGTNYAATRYVNWTSWASASTIWPNAGDGSSTQGESSGMAVYAHELSHLLDIRDNYNNPYSDPPLRSYTGPWSMLSRGSFNGPGGPHTRWEIPARQGSSLGSLHTVRDKLQLGLTENSTVAMVTKAQLAASGPLVAELTARSVDSGLLGVRIMIGNDSAPACNQSTDPFCDGRGYNNYEMEVVDRMGADSFQPDHGVMISKTKDEDDAPFQWTIDANPQDIDTVDFYLPNGTEFMISLGDYRQLADALFHAGTDSGSEFEYVDEANGLHLYIIDIHRDDTGVLRYTVGARSLEGAGSASHGVEMGAGEVVASGSKGYTCAFELTNSGSAGPSGHDEVSEYQGTDIYRLSAEVEGEGWKVKVPNALAAAKFGESTTARVAVGAAGECSGEAVVKLTATSESDPSVSVTKECRLSK